MPLQQCIFSMKAILIFCSNIPASKTSFWARPLKTENDKLIVWLNMLKKFVLEVLLAAFLKKRMAVLITTENDSKF